MRQIGQLPGGQARVFSDFLVARGIANTVERENDGTYTIWVHDEDRMVDAQTYLDGFHAHPAAAEFQRAGVEAEEARARTRKEAEDYRKRVRSRRSLFTSMGSFGVGVLTYILVTLCALIFIYTRMGGERSAVEPFFISDPLLGGKAMPEVFSGHVWRLFTPILIHFGILHILFNMMLLFQLGSMIEARQGTFKLLLLILGTAAISNVAQLQVTGSPRFGGMSGVVYAMAGYAWIQGRLNRESGLFLDGTSMLFLLVWGAICYMGWVGPVANTAHAVGLISGLVWGFLSATFSTRHGRE